MKNIPSIFCKKPVFIGLLLITANMAAQAQQTAVPTDNKPSAPATATPVAIPYPGIRNLNNTGKFNYIRTTVPDMPVQSLSGSFYRRESTDYFDGLGRPLQTVVKKGNAAGNDIVSVRVYDSLGRETYQYLPYAAPTGGLYYSPLGGSGKIKLNDSTQMRGFYEQQGIDEQPYSQTVFESSPLNRVVKQMAPGKSWVGNNRGVTYDYKTNSPWSYNFGMWAKVLLNAYPKWTIGAAMGSIPQYAGSYDAGQLNIVTTTDEDGKQAWEVKDKAGLVLMKMQKAGTATSNLHPTDFAYTFYVYDQLNRLRCVMPPEAVKPQINADGWSISWNVPNQQQLDGLCYQYLYDERSRPVEKKIPGKEVEYYVYDKRDRLIHYQDGKLRAENKWAFTLYDALDRPIVTGTGNSNGTTRNMVVNAVNTYFPTATTDLWYYLQGYSFYHNYPAAINGCQILSYTYYDDYTNLSNFSFDANMFTGLSIPTNGTVDPIPTAASTMTRGLPTGTKVRVMDPDDPNADNWLTSVNYYDDKGRVIQTKSQNLKGGVDVSSNLYFFQGMLYKNILSHQNPHAVRVTGTTDAPILEYTLENTFERNLGMQGGNDLVKWHRQKINNGIDYDLAQYGYDHLGRNVAKKFTAGRNLQQYNIRGFLDYTAFRDFQTDPDTLFDERLFYDNGFASKLYNGNIAGIIWRGRNHIKKAYGYSYDNLNRLTHAEFNQYGNQSGSWAWNKLDKFDYTASNITYDLNGNILSMNQMAPNADLNQNPVQMDAMVYHYTPNSNRLINVYDAGTTDVNLPDFKDNANHDPSMVTNVEYQYDDNGNLISDANKSITSIDYTDLNKPAKIVVDEKGEIRYVYDATGNRLQKRVYDYTVSATDPIETWDYIGNFVYKNNELQYILNDEGRARPVAVQVGTTTDYATKFVYDYFVKDHLGNVRSTVTAKPMTSAYYASMEIASANIEELMFDNIPNVRDLKPGSTNPDDNKAARLNGAEADKRIGTAIMLRTKPGDRFHISTKSYYEGEYTPEENAGSEEMVEALMETLMGGQTYAGVPISELPDNARTVQDLLSNSELAGQLETLTNTNDNPELPKAHLNYLWFDATMRLDMEHSGSVQVIPSNAGSWTVLTGGNDNILTATGNGSEGIYAPGNGFLVVYIDNQSIGKDVWFDNVSIDQYHSEVLEEDHFYPFGLTTNVTPTLVEAQKNSYKLTTMELESHFDLSMYDFGARMQDMQLGRWNGIDKLAEKYYSISPYNYCGNNPTRYIDLDGKKIVVYYNGQAYPYTPGVKPKEGSPEILNKVHEAISYAMKSKTGAKIWSTVGNSEKTVDIRFKDASLTDRNTNEFRPIIEGRRSGDNNLGTIEWDYNSKLITSGGWNTDEGNSVQNGYMSPSTVLTHEGGHVYDMLLALSHGLDSKEWAEFRANSDGNMGQDSQYGTIEERNNIINNETPYINETNAREQKQNGSKGSYNRTRKNHGGEIDYNNNNADVNTNPSKSEQQSIFNIPY